MTDWSRRLETSGKFVPDHTSLAETVAELQEAGQTVVFVNGCFDLFHVGHLRYLQSARELGDVLVAAVNSDRTVTALKGEGLPINPERERAEVLSGLGCVDYVTIFDSMTVDPVLETLKPDIHAKGTDWTADTVPERKTVLAYGGRVAIAGDPKDHSTTGLLERIREYHERYASLR